jgi:hypothetical protein
MEFHVIPSSSMCAMCMASSLGMWCMQRHHSEKCDLCNILAYDACNIIIVRMVHATLASLQKWSLQHYHHHQDQCRSTIIVEFHVAFIIIIIVIIAVITSMYTFIIDTIILVDILVLICIRRRSVMKS